MAAPTVAPATRLPGVLDLPSATTMRFVLLTAAMLVAGLFVGISVFNAVDGQAFAAAYLACGGRISATCLAPYEYRYALFALGGAVTVAVAAAVVVLAVPAFIVRRNRLRDPGPIGAAATARLVAFCADAGIRRPPRLLAGSATLRDAFSLGRPGRYAVAVPLKLLLRSDTPLFEAALRHELAHVRHHDVALSWLARAVGYVLAPLLLIPFVAFVLSGETDLLPGYVGRAVVVAAVVTLAVCSALRSRELSADVSAARLAGAPVVDAALSTLRAPTTARWRRVLAVHPSRDERVAAVYEPGRTATLTVVDGAVLGFLIALMLPTLDLFFSAVLVDVDDGGVPFVLASALVLSPLAGVTLGLGFLRQASVAQAGTPRTAAAPVLGGVAGGAVAGQLTSLAGVGLAGAAGLDHPLLVLVVAAALTGATALTAGGAEIWAGVRAVPPAAVASVATATALFVTALWAADVVRGLLDQVGWSAVPPTVRAQLTAVPVTLVAVALAVMVIGAQWSSRALRSMPAAPAPKIGQTLAAGVAAGIGGAAVLVANRILRGAPADAAASAERFMDNWWIAAGGGAGAAVALALTCGRRGWGAGLLAGPVAAVVVAIGNLGQLTATNGLPLPPGTVSLVVGTDLALGLLVTVPVAALVPAHGTPVPTRPTAMIVVCAALLAAVAGSAAVAATPVLTAAAVVDPAPTPSAPSAGAPLPAPPAAAPVPTPPAEPVTPLATLDYKAIAPVLSHGYAAVRTEMDAVDRESAPASTRVAQIDDRILPDLQRLLAQARTIAPTDSAVAALHDHLLTSLQLAIAAHQDFARSLAGNDSAALARGRVELGGATQELTTWTTGVSRL